MEEIEEMFCDAWVKFKSFSTVLKVFYVLCSPIIILLMLLAVVLVVPIVLFCVIINWLCDSYIFLFIFYVLRALVVIGIVGGVVALIVLALLKYLFNFSVI